MDFYISDLHNGDSNIITYEHRPFKDINHMKDVLISNWNSKVSDCDNVWILGDIGNIEILRELKGIKKIILGNHDNINNIKTNFPDIQVYDYPIMVGALWLSHEPILYMPKELPYLNIHGHIHSFNYGIGNTWEEGKRHFNVSVEKINYTPISRDEIIKLLKYKEC